MGEQELFTLGVAIAVVVIVGRVVATRLELPEAVVFVVLGVLASLIPQVPNIDLSPDLVLVLFLPPLEVSPLIRFLPGKHSLFVVNPWRYRLVIGWGGMRGAISLAIALTLPNMLNGQPFGQRSVLILLAAGRWPREQQ